MDYMSVLQGAVLQNSYRALLLLPAPADAPKASLQTAGGPQHERLQVTPVTRAPLGALLKERGVAAFSFEATRLRPGRFYRFVFSDGRITNAIEVYTLPTALPAQGITVAVGSCFFEGFDAGVRLEQVLRRPWLGQRALLQFWSGDNVYVDIPSEGPLSANQPYVHTLERYLKYFYGTSYMRARAAAPNYTTYDDHELWNNFPEHMWWLGRTAERERSGYTHAAWACLDLFQADLNPSPDPALFKPVQDAARPGRSFHFELAPLSFFFADVRSNRQRLHESARMLLPRDLEALQDWAHGLKGPGVLVLGQPLCIKTRETYDYNPPSFGHEYRAIWRALREAPFDVLVISGDVHHSRLLRCSFDAAPSTRFVYELVSSPAAHIPHTVASALPSFMAWPGSGRVSPPDDVKSSGQMVALDYYFGTPTQNCMGFLSFVPGPDRSVAVRALFVDYEKEPKVARNVRVSNLNNPFRFEHCGAEGTLFTLRRRPPLAA